MYKSLSCIVLFLASIVDAEGKHPLSKRVLPTNQNCDPQYEVCRKGDWIDTRIADCERDGYFFTCNAQNDVWYSWTVDVAEDDYCKPVTGLRFRCGKAGTNTRCVCSDHKLYFNRCRCQYWPDEDAGASLPAACRGYYTGGTSTLHHWGCCNNCNDSTANTCDGRSWHGGSTYSYCSSCGENTGGGRIKYYFNCGSCDEQQECADYCSGPILNLPGLCWKWLDCFKGCCLQRTQQPSRSIRQIESFCGDGTCNEEESPYTCPTDCCYQINSVCAENNTNRCDLQCCGSPSCCLENSTDSTGSTATTLLFSFYSKFTILAMVFLAVIL